MEALGNYAFTHYDTVRSGLRDNDTFISGEGAAGDAFGCQYQRGNSVASDPPLHTTLRGAIAPPLKVDEIAQLRVQVQNVADELVDACLTESKFNAMTELAQPMPLAIVRDLVGLPDFGRENMLKWAGAAFDVQGMQNERGKAAVVAIEEMREFVVREATPDKLKPGSWTHRIGEMVNAGELAPELAPFAIRDYINPSLDTTISAIGHLIYHLGKDPETWEVLRDDPTLANNAAHEAVRIGTPIRSFSRHAARSVEISGIEIPQGSRVMMLYASANRDEAMFAEAGRFNIKRRNARRHLGFGAGIHMCVGMHLATLEIECLITAMINKVSKVEVGEPIVAMNNTICAFSELPVKFNA
jgi:cytochrome P450